MLTELLGLDKARSATNIPKLMEFKRLLTKIKDLGWF